MIEAEVEGVSKYTVFAGGLQPKMLLYHILVRVQHWQPYEAKCLCIFSHERLGDSTGPRRLACATPQDRSKIRSMI